MPPREEIYLGGVLIAAGALIAGASGLCSAAFVVGAFRSGGGSLGVALPVVLVFGGPPVALGLFLLLRGLRIVRSGNKERR